MCARSPQVEKIFCAPGNGGTAALAQNVPINATSGRQLAEFAEANAIDLVIIGPDAALASGVADACLDRGVAAFGPTAAASKLESSKEFAKSLMDACGVPTPRWQGGDRKERQQLESFAAELGGRCVVKADGLALGKGVAVCDTYEEATAAIANCFDNNAFGLAGSRVLVEERLTGPEVSLFAICDGEDFVLLPLATDYKRAYDDDAGPNTGGMGAYSPPHNVDVAELLAESAKQVVAPTLQAMRERGSPYVGCLYAGLMLTSDGLRVIEFNARFGDPETQVLMPVLSRDFIDVLVAATGHELSGVPPISATAAAVTVVIAQAGYPQTSASGVHIKIPNELPESVTIFHAGTGVGSGGIYPVTGGRVLGITGTGANVDVARQAAYDVAGPITGDGLRFRADIAAVR
jgi:phosphoribosylamine--glycine ligase